MIRILKCCSLIMTIIAFEVAMGATVPSVPDVIDGSIWWDPTCSGGEDIWSCAPDSKPQKCRRKSQFYCCCNKSPCTVTKVTTRPCSQACPSTKVTYCANPAPCVVKCSVDPKSSDIQKVECFAHQPSVPVRVAPECPCQATVAMQIKPKYVCPAPCPLACDKRVVSDDDAAACILHQLGFYDDGDDVDNCADLLPFLKHCHLNYVCQHAQPPVIVQTTPCCTPPVVSQVGYCGGSPVYAHVTPTTCAESVPVCTASIVPHVPCCDNDESSVLTNVGCCGGSPVYAHLTPVTCTESVPVCASSIVPHVSCCHGNALTSCASSCCSGNQSPLFVCEIKRQTEKPKVKKPAPKRRVIKKKKVVKKRPVKKSPPRTLKKTRSGAKTRRN